MAGADRAGGLSANPFAPMTRVQRFSFSFEMSAEFVEQEPVTAARWMLARYDEFARVQLMEGPRGGLYRLFTEPTSWMRYPSRISQSISVSSVSGIEGCGRS